MCILFFKHSTVRPSHCGGLFLEAQGPTCSIQFNVSQVNNTQKSYKRCIYLYFYMVKVIQRG